MMHIHRIDHPRFRTPPSADWVLWLVFCFVAPWFSCQTVEAARASFLDTLRSKEGELPPVRAITRGPKYHWFGYYDKFQFDPTDRYVLCMEVDFEHRSPRPDDVIKIGMIDLKDGNRWTELGTSSAWCWQQGCMLQWRPGSDREVLWNDRDGDRYVCRVLDVRSGKRRTLPHPIHHVSPDGRWALVTDVARVGEMRPGYGYVGIPDPNRDVAAPADSGLWKMNLDTGETRLLFSLADIARDYPTKHPEKSRHYFNHIQWSPDGSRFLFLNRGRGVGTRMFTAAADGTDLRLVHLGSSHYTWRDPKTILIWARKYVLVNDDTSLRSKTLWRATNGHESYLRGKEWIITDTYPLGTRREQVVYLYHVPSGDIVPVGFFPSPKEYRGEWRCDTHPRLSRDGTKVCIDSPHAGNGRQLYLIDIAGIISKKRPPPVKARSVGQNGEGKPQPVRLPEWSPPDEVGRSKAFVLDPKQNKVHIWGKGLRSPTWYFDEFLPGLFQRTLVLDKMELRGSKLHWIFTGDDGGITVSITDSTVEVTERLHGASGLSQIPGATTTRHTEYIAKIHRFPYESTLRAVTVTMDHRLHLRVALNGREVLGKLCEIDLTRHQLVRSGEHGFVRGRCVWPAPVACSVTVDPTETHQMILGFGGITTPPAYAQLSPKGKHRWWERVCEYNLLVQREYPVGTRLSRKADNWDRLSDAVPHYYCDNFPNGEISDFDYIRTLRKLGGMVWFEFWRLPPWTCQDWRDASGKLHRGVVDPKKYVEAMLSYCKTSQRRTGAPPDVLGIQNERHQPTPLWYEMTLALRKGLDDAGFKQVRIHMSDASRMRNGISWLRELHRSPEAWAATDYVATHVYDYQNYFPNPDGFDKWLQQWNELAAGKPFLSTEICVNSSGYQWKSYRLALSMGQLYHKNLVLADATAICYCWTLLNVVQPSYGWTRTLFVPDPANGFVPKASSRQLRVFGAFSRRLPAGMVRVDARSSDPDVLASAYVGPGGKKTLILLNRSTAHRNVKLQWADAEFTDVELVDPYHANESIAEERKVSPGSFALDPGSILTLTNVPRGRLPDDFVIHGTDDRR